jgi:3-isopropylmalate/(R)-2-methylmalate dehydratase small subunit
MSIGIVHGRALVFGDEVNTDDMYPGFAMRLPVAEAVQHLFSVSRPGWAREVQPGDIVVAGRRFGLGSSRPVAQLLREAGVSCLIAEQYNSLFLRNCINYGLPAVTVPNAREIIADGDILQVDVAGGALVNLSRAITAEFDKFPDFILGILSSGGIIEQLRGSGYLKKR